MKQPGDDYTVGDWVDAMESGRYKMIRGHLGNPGSENHCALGVLYEEMRAIDSKDFDFEKVAAISASLTQMGISQVVVATTNDRSRTFGTVVGYLQRQACRDTVIGKVFADEVD